MLFRATRLFFKFQLKQETCAIVRTIHEEAHQSPGQKSVSEIFFNKKVQKLLKNITKGNPGDVFKMQKLGKLTPPSYKFMTNEELEAAQKKIKHKMDSLLQIPPILDVKNDDIKILSDDSFLDGHDKDHAKMIFTDITFGVKDKERVIVVREPNGTLRTASENERHRMSEVYFPRIGRKIEPPKMFEEEHLEVLLNKGEYLFVLDRACAQYEPDDAEYQRVAFATYEKINEKSHFDHVRSTRHFGALAFYLVLNRRIDNILLYIIQSEKIEEAISMVHLYHIVHPDCKSCKAKATENEIDVLKAYIKEDSFERSRLELTLNSYLALQKNKKAMDEGIHQAHGL